MLSSYRSLSLLNCLMFAASECDLCNYHFQESSHWPEGSNLTVGILFDQIQFNNLLGRTLATANVKFKFIAFKSI